MVTTVDMATQNILKDYKVSKITILRKKNNCTLKIGILTRL